jgi:hypothetical protein
MWRKNRWCRPVARIANFEVDRSLAKLLADASEHHTCFAHALRRAKDLQAIPCGTTNRTIGKTPVAETNVNGELSQVRLRLSSTALNDASGKSIAFRVNKEAGRGEILASQQGQLRRGLIRNEIPEWGRIRCA